MPYSGRTPEGASRFETLFGLKPLGPEVTSGRLARLEEIAGLFILAATDPLSDRASIEVGTFGSNRVKVPLPSEEAVESTLDPHRMPEERGARIELARYLAQYEEGY